jgi:hypothetical protein
MEFGRKEVGAQCRIEAAFTKNFYELCKQVMGSQEKGLEQISAPMCQIDRHTLLEVALSKPSGGHAILPIWHGMEYYTLQVDL